MNIDQLHFPNYGYSLGKLPDDVLSNIKEEILVIKKNISSKEKIHKNLAGHLETQIYLDKTNEIIKPYILDLAVQYITHWSYECEIYKNFPSNEPLSFELDKVWVNFQKKYEYNPLHDHCGVFSFVSWIDIPYELKDEMEMSHVTSSNFAMATTFNFVFTNIFGDVQSFPFFVEKQHEGTILFFPSRLKHLVYPFFTSNEYRISISGNLFLSK
jgi:hypothetical protein